MAGLPTSARLTVIQEYYLKASAYKSIQMTAVKATGMAPCEVLPKPACAKANKVPSIATRQTHRIG